MVASGHAALGYTLQCVWYADLLRDEDGGLWPTLAADVRRSFSGLGEGATVRGWLDTLLSNESTQPLSDWVVQLSLKQAWRYLNDPLPRAGARIRLHQAIGLETRVLIAHSLGSL